MLISANLLLRDSTLWMPWALTVLLILSSGFARAERVVIAGVHQNAPGSSFDDQGNVEGFYVDIFEYTARQENWSVSYVTDSWPKLLEKMDNSEIDLMVGIAHTRERETKYDYGQETMMSNWGQVYVKDQNIQSILSLAGKKLVGLRNDTYTLAFQNMLRSFDIRASSFEYVDDNEDILRRIDNGLVDAGVISRSVALSMESRYDIVKSPILCCAREIRFAAPKGKSPHLLATLDNTLRTLKNDNNSLYFQSMNRWFANTSTRFTIPAWVRWAAVITLGILLLFTINLLILRKQVALRTAELLAARDELEDRVNTRTEELANANEKLRFLSYHDELTGLPNRRWFTEHLEVQLKLAQRSKEGMAVFFLDLDGFKSINDTLGHDVGDIALIEASARIRGCLRASDLIARLGGDEFTIALPGVKDVPACHQVADTILKAFSEEFSLNENRATLGVSIGISMYTSETAGANALLSQADAAMYESKQKGKNQYTVYDSSS